MHHLIKSQQFSRDILEEIFSLADYLEYNETLYLQNKIMASLFYEPSTRTRLSFESAMCRLGGSVISTENAREFSSSAKGESLEDSIRVIQNYADIIVLRHFEEGSAEKAALVSEVPIINAGDGAGQHPTQALLDTYTINRELGFIDGVTIAMVGDLKHGRTVRSLSYLLGKFKDIKIIFVSPEELKIGKDIITYLNKHKISYAEVSDLNEVIGEVDVIYQTRIQKERFANPSDYEALKNSFIIDDIIANKMKEKSIIMHPLPRINEITLDVDSNPRAAYFKQAHYGLLVRKAIIARALNNPISTSLSLFGSLEEVS